MRICMQNPHNDAHILEASRPALYKSDHRSVCSWLLSTIIGGCLLQRSFYTCLSMVVYTCLSMVVWALSTFVEALLQ